MTSQPVSIGGQPVAILERPRTGGSKQLHFLSATLLPGRGMSLLQLQAYLPEKGEIGLLDAPSLADAKKILDENDDEFGNKVFHFGAGALIPFPNRITGTVSADGKTIQTTVAGKSVSLPANWRGKNPAILSIHGLLQRAKFQDLKLENGSSQSHVSAIFHAGDFDGHWLSQTDINTSATLEDTAFTLSVTAKNVGKETLPISIAYHPNFTIPSGKRAQVRLHIPAAKRAVGNNYDDVLPTGKIEDVKNTPYDFTDAKGKDLGSFFMDDTFTALQRRADGSVAVEITDPAANYGMRIVSLSPEIKAIQVYTPLDKNFVAVEPQFNLVDPYNKVWGNTDTGMVSLKPGQSVTWKIRLELFTPGR